MPKPRARSAIAALRKDLAENRDRVLAENLPGYHDGAKDLLLSLIGGQKALPSSVADSPFVAQVQSLSLLLRWIACSCNYEEYKLTGADPQKNFAEASAFAVWWQRAEVIGKKPPLETAPIPILSCSAIGSGNGVTKKSGGKRGMMPRRLAAGGLRRMFQAVARIASWVFGWIGSFSIPCNICRCTTTASG